MLDENKKLVRRLYTDCWNKGQLDSLDQFITSDCRFHDPVFPSLTSGLENYRRHIQNCRTGFPDLHFSIEDVIAEKDEVVLHWMAEGTHKGQFLGMAPTNRKAKVSGTSIARIKGGKIAEQWADWNLMTLLEELGIATAPKISSTEKVGARART